MKYDLEILYDYIGKGLVVKQDHPTLPLSIYNYSRTCQYGGLWDDITINMRGTILDNEGNVIARSFPKFFNIEELEGNKFKENKIPNEAFTVTDKMDGSLGILFYYNNEWHLASKGSFTSDQAIKGRLMLNRYDLDAYLSQLYSYSFEIIYDENRIVVDYGFEDMVLIGAFDAWGNEVDIQTDLYKNHFNVVKQHNGIKDCAEIKQMIDPTQEGYVVRFKSGMRMKIKGEEYVRLHRIITNFSSKDIWELLMNGEPIEPFLERVPDEFDKWVKQQISSFKYGKYRIGEHCGKIHDYFRYGKYGDVDPEPTKKEFALHLDKCDVETHYRSILFAMWDGRPYDHMIWKIMKPKYEKPFWNKEGA